MARVLLTWRRGVPLAFPPCLIIIISNCCPQAEVSCPGGRLRLRALMERALAEGGSRQAAAVQRWARGPQRQQQQAAAAPPLPADDPPELLFYAAGCQTPGGSCAAASAHCPALWQLYLQLELGQGNEAAARRVFLRGLHACPGAKELWLAGLGKLAAGMAGRELSGLLDSMAERGVRSRTDVYEVLLESMDVAA
jgi:hypothetical protein